MRTFTTIVLGVLLAGCGKGKDQGKDRSDPPKGSPATKSPGSAVATEPTPAPDAAPKELPPPPKEAFKGKARLVNLLVGRDGKATTVDVWARRTFTEGPVLLAHDVAVGTASDWFAVPESHSVVVVPAGAGSDAPELGGMFAPKEGEQQSSTLTLGQDGTPSCGLTSFVVEKPTAGKGLVVLEAGAFQGHADAFKPMLGAWGYAFHVGDGTACRASRQQGLMLGGTNYVDYEVDPGTSTFTLHGGEDYDCKQPPVYTMTLDVAADAAVMVHVYTPDAKAIAHLALPLEL